MRQMCWRDVGVIMSQAVGKDIGASLLRFALFEFSQVAVIGRLDGRRVGRRGRGVQNRFTECVHRQRTGRNFFPRHTPRDRTKGQESPRRPCPRTWQ